MTVDEIISENTSRLNDIEREFNPLTGKGCVLERFKILIDDYILPVQYLPMSMKNIRLVKLLRENGSIQNVLNRLKIEPEDYERAHEELVTELIKLRIKHDFCFWAYSYVRIKNKYGGKNIPFRLNIAQRKLLTVFEKKRLSHKPIRVILLKARQWGGSTLTQMYMAWIQLVHKEGFYSAIVAQDSGTSRKIRAMYTKMLSEYPPELLNLKNGDKLELMPYEGSHNDAILSYNKSIVRDCVICIGTAERPDNIRGGDISLVHYSEVALWKKTLGKSPEDIIRSVSSSIPILPLTMDIIESTANGTGNFFHEEWSSAIDKTSDREAVFIAWFDIEMYSIKFESENLRRKFAKKLYENRMNTKESNRTESGMYYWKIFQMGATLESIQWYISKRKSYNSHADMASEFPSDDVEAFKHSGSKVFNEYFIEELKKSCRKQTFIGEVRGDDVAGFNSLNNLRFVEDKQGSFSVWDLPEEDNNVKYRYIVIVDVGGRSKNSDFSDILVIDRYWMMEGDKPTIAAEWHGHIRHDLLAWKAAQISTFYKKALLVIESNTLETKDKDRDTDGNHTEYILNQIADVYDNLYSRKQSEESIAEGKPKRWGFHTNAFTKPMIIDNLVKLIEENGYVEREIEAIYEYLWYEKKQNGALGAIIGKHDDRLMVRAIGLYIAFCEMDLPKRIEEKIKTNTIRKPITEATF